MCYLTGMCIQKQQSHIKDEKPSGTFTEAEVVMGHIGLPLLDMFALLVVSSYFRMILLYGMV